MLLSIPVALVIGLSAQVAGQGKQDPRSGQGNPREGQSVRVAVHRAWSLPEETRGGLP